MAGSDLIKFIEAKNLSGDSVDIAAEVLSFLNNEKSQEAVCLACSGGSDSIFLVNYLLENFPNLRTRLIVLHFNHNLREQESEDDEKFVKNFAESKRLKFYSEKLSNPPGNPSEDVLRKYRNGFFERALERFFSNVLLLGHQKNDIAETLLMRLIRASDLAGLAAPRAITIFDNGRRVKLRPLLNFSKAEIEDELRKDGLIWREDSSNFENKFFRNKIRNIILPQLQIAANRFNVLNAFAAVRKNFEESDEAINFFVQKCLNGRNLKNEIEIHDLIEFPAAILKKVFICFLLANEIEVRKSFVALFIQRIRATNFAIFSVGRTRFVKFDGRKFFIIDNEKQNGWLVENLKIGQNSLPGGRLLTIENIKLTPALVKNLQNLDQSKHCYAMISSGAIISAKNYESSYRYVRIGHKSAKKLGDLLPRKDKKSDLPVIFVDDEICWVPNLPVSDAFKIKENEDEALLLTYS